MLKNLLDSQFFTLSLTLILLGVSYILLYFVKKRFNLAPEISRKIIHISLGLTTLSFPWIFHETWPVWLMSIVSIGLLLILRYSKLRNNLGASLHSVNRHSFGEICFPLSVAILFQLSHQEPVFYIISILVLTLADALAALIGVYYGKAHYDASEGIKSFEGSFFFFITAFLCIQIPLLLMTDFSNVNIILVAFFIALLITLCEAVSWQGLDNLFIPLGVYVTLTNYLNYQTYTLLLLSLTLIFIIICGFYLRAKSTMNLSALLFCIVIGFLYVTLDPFSFVIPLGMFLLYSYIIRKQQKELINSHNVLTVFYLNIGGFFWAFLNNNGHNEFVMEFSVYYCIQMGIISWIHNHLFYKKFSIISPLLHSLILFTVIFFIYKNQLSISFYNDCFYYLLYTTISLFLSLSIFIFWNKKNSDIPMNRTRLIVQGGSAFLGSIIFYTMRIAYA